MRILFVHQNFPGQFLHLAPALAARGHELRALTAEGNQRPSPVPVMRYAPPTQRFDVPSHGYGAHFAEQAKRGEAVALAAAKLAREGYRPDAVLGHPGWGETLFLKEIWPDARLDVYAEFFYRPRGLDVGFDPELQQTSLQQAIWVTARQASQLLALSQADRALAPTRWQASTYPDALRGKITVQHDGVDVDVMAPDPAAVAAPPGLDRVFRPGDELVTFVNRNLEPYRGYHTFIRALPAVLAARPNARVVIVGGDGVSYGAKAPEGKSWKDIFLDEVRDRLDLSRVHFVGRVPYPTFVALMKATRAHAYLTYPFVVSWSMLEAMAAGALVIGSRTKPVEEMIEDGVTGRLVDFFDVDAWSEALIEALAHPERFEAIRRAARDRAVAQYDLKRICLPRLIDWIEAR